MGTLLSFGGDKWLPLLTAPSLQGLLPAELQDATVNSLTNPFTQT